MTLKLPKSANLSLALLILTILTLQTLAQEEESNTNTRCKREIVESYNLNGKYSLFAACRLSDMKMGQLVTLELPEDELKFKARFVPD